jgi:hypothetical protein
MEPEWSKNSTFCENEVKTSIPRGKAEKVTISRLDQLGLCMTSAEGCPETALAGFAPRRKARQGRQAKKRPLAHAVESPRIIRKWREGRGFSPAMESCYCWGALAPEAARLQGLKAKLIDLRTAAGLKPRPSTVPRYDVLFRH